MEAGKDINIDLNRFRRNCPATIGGVWLTGGASRVKVGPMQVFEQSSGPFGGVDFEVLDQGAENFVPNAGATYRKNTAQALTAGTANTIAFQTVSDVAGNVQANMPIGSWTVPAKGAYVFAAGVACNAGGGESNNFINITRNGTTGTSAIANGSAYAGSTDAPTLQVASGIVLCNKGDIIRVVANPGVSRTAQAAVGTYFDARRVS